jgi:hypothetical protein
VDDVQPGGARGGEDALGRRDRFSEQRHVVPERFAEERLNRGLAPRISRTGPR